MKSVFHTADLSAEQVPNPTAQFGGARAYVAMPMPKDDVLIGPISIYRQEVQPFTDKQIALVQNFAAQLRVDFAAFGDTHQRIARSDLTSQSSAVIPQ